MARKPVSVACEGEATWGKAAAMEPGTMKCMVAFTESSSNESYVEPSPNAWFRSRAPIPTSYALACDPLYPFQEILKNRTSRARGITGNCTEVVERKFSICIEIWQVELESCVWRVSFHKYAYVHGDPIQGIDPTGMFLGTLLSVGIGMMIPGPGDMIQGALTSLVGAYFSNLQFVQSMLDDPTIEDDLFPFLDDKWVTVALLSGVKSAFNVSIPFTGIDFNPLDLAMAGLAQGDMPDSDANYDRVAAAPLGNGAAQMAAARPQGPNRLRVGRFIVNKLSEVRDVVARGQTYSVTMYYHVQQNFKVAIFPKSAIVRGTNGRPIEIQIPVKRQDGSKDVADAWAELKRTDPDAYSKYYGKTVKDSSGNVVTKNGMPVYYHMHHSHKHGIMQLIPGDIHGEVRHFGGNRLWNRGR